MPMPGLTFDEAYFHGSRQGYSDYSEAMLDFDTHVDTLRNNAIQKGFQIDGRKALVLGCAFGYTIKYMLTRNVQGYGIDISQYAVSQLAPEAQGRVVRGDALVRSVINQAKALAGMSNNQRFDLIVTEDLLPCLTDAEITAGLVEWRRHTMQVMHRISTSDRGEYEGGYNLKTLAAWKAMVGNQDWVYDYTTWQEG